MKTWEKPKLIILVRGHAEERILSACKTMAAAPGSSIVDFSNCDSDIEPCDYPCDSIASS